MEKEIPLENPEEIIERVRQSPLTKFIKEVKEIETKAA